MDFKRKFIKFSLILVYLFIFTHCVSIKNKKISIKTDPNSNDIKILKEGESNYVKNIFYSNLIKSIQSKKILHALSTEIKLDFDDKQVETLMALLMEKQLKSFVLINQGDFSWNLNKFKQNELKLDLIINKKDITIQNIKDKIDKILKDLRVIKGIKGKTFTFTVSIENNDENFMKNIKSYLKDKNFNIENSFLQTENEIMASLSSK